MTRALHASRSLGAAVGLALFGLTSPARAEQPRPEAKHGNDVEEHSGAGPRGVTYPEALALAARRSPLLGPALADREGARELERQSRAALLRPPELSASAGPRFSADATRVDVTTMLTQPFSLSRAGAARETLADARGQAARARFAEALAAAKLAAASAWVASRSAAELLTVRREALRHALGLEALAKARTAAGTATAGEEALARALRGAAVAAVLEAEGREFAANVDLAIQCGEEDDQLVASGELDGGAMVPSEERALSASAQHPRLKYLDSEAGAAALAAEQVKAEGGPWLTVGPSLSREGTGDVILLGHVVVSLPLVNPNAFEAAERARVARIAKAEGDRARRLIRAEARLAWHEVWHARRTRDALLRDALAPARSALNEATLRYREGKARLDEVLVARRALTESEERSLEARAQARLAELRLQGITGQLQSEAP